MNGRFLPYLMIDEETREQVAREVKEYFISKVPKKMMPVDPEVATKVYACLSNPPKSKNHPWIATAR